MTPKMRLRLGIGWKIFLALLGLVVGLMIAGDARKVFDLSGRTLFVASASVAAATAIEGLLGALRQRAAGYRATVKLRVQKILTQLLVDVTASTCCGPTSATDAAASTATTVE